MGLSSLSSVSSTPAGIKTPEKSSGGAKSLAPDKDLRAASLSADSKNRELTPTLESEAKESGNQIDAEA